MSNMWYPKQQPLIGLTGLGGGPDSYNFQSAGAYAIERSIRLNKDDPAYLYRTFDEEANRKTFTLSGWYRLTNMGSQRWLWMVGADGNNKFQLCLEGVAQLNFECTHSGSEVARFYTADMMRDPAGWYHIVLAIDTTQTTASDRMKIYINGTEPTLGGQSVSTNYPAEDLDFLWGENSATHYMGKRSYSLNANDPSNYYMSENYYIDGLQLTASSFGEIDSNTGQWIPTKYTGSYGNAGYYLDFKDVSSTTTLGYDVSGNVNTWTTSGFDLATGTGYDSMVDTPTNTYATLNSIIKDKPTISDGNLAFSTAIADQASSTIGVGSGKWYCEFICGGTGNGAWIAIVTNPNYRMSSSDTDGIDDAGTICIVTSVDAHYAPNCTADVTTGATWSTNDKIGIALDADNQTVDFYQNGTKIWGFTSFTLAGPYFFAFDRNTSGGSTNVHHVNFGQQSFGHQVSGYNEVCTSKMDTPAIKYASKYFNTGTYTGTGSSHSISGLGFSPNNVVIKMRNTANQDFQCFDTVRGANKVLRWNTQETSDTQTTRFTSFDADGFTVGTENITNQSGKNFVYWAWKESVTSGCDIVEYTGDGNTPRTVSHSLGVVPQMIIVKCMTQNSTRWIVYHEAIGNTKNVFLQSTDDAETTGNFWASTTPTSSVFTVNDGAEVNADGETYIAYLWASVEGMCKVNQYYGNNDNDGAFVYCGFRPSFMLIKNQVDNESWAIYDDARGYNDENPVLTPTGYNNGVEITDKEMDILSNGFKPRISSNWINQTDPYLYIAMSRAPFKYARAK